jgi:hypothetical protein
MKPALRANEGALKARTVKDHDLQKVRKNRGSRIVKTLQAVCGIDRLRVWQDGGVIKLMDAILAQAKKAVALPEAFHRRSRPMSKTRSMSFSLLVDLGGV